MSLRRLLILILLWKDFCWLLESSQNTMIKDISIILLQFLVFLCRDKVCVFISESLQERLQVAKKKMN